jgi:quercetin dioxygenase-like cupin family protein
VERSFYHGSMERDSRGPYRGWLLGSFVVDHVRKVDELEIKYWEFDQGLTDHPRKTSDIVEFTTLLEGMVRGEIDEEEILLRAGEYVIIPRGVPNNTVIEAIRPSRGLTVKAPSDPTAKRLVT